RDRGDGRQDVDVVIGEGCEGCQERGGNRGGSDSSRKHGQTFFVREIHLMLTGILPRSCPASRRRPSSESSLPSGTVRPAYASPNVQRAPRSRQTTRAHGWWATKRTTRRASRASTRTSCSPISSLSKSASWEPRTWKASARKATSRPAKGITSHAPMTHAAA